MNENIYTRVKNFMKSKDYTFNESWLKECAQYCVETHPKLTVESIQSFAIEQWLLSNLREINNENGCLPKNLAKKKNTTLNGSYILQMEKMYDISTSKYKQLEKIRKNDVENVKETETEKSDLWEPKGKRMFQLVLSDGVQDILAIEYKPIKLFNEILLPGYKLKITGPLTCRRGIVMLEEKNISGLGGEIEDLLIFNSLENVLARALNLKENPDPYNDNKKKEGSIKSDFDEGYLNTLIQLARSQDSEDNQESNSDINKSTISNLPSEYKLNPEQNTDEIFGDDELEALLEDPDIVDEFPPMEVMEISESRFFKVPRQPTAKMPQKIKISSSIRKQGSLDDHSSRSWNNVKESKGSYYSKISQKINITEPDNSLTSDSPDDNLILEDKDLIILQPSAVQISKLSVNEVASKMPPKIKITSKNLNPSVHSSIWNQEFPDDHSYLNVEHKDSSRSWNKVEGIKSSDHSRISQKINITENLQPEDSLKSDSLDDNLILEDKDLIIFQPSAGQISKLSDDVALGIKKFPNKKSFAPKNSHQLLSSKFSCLKTDKIINTNVDIRSKNKSIESNLDWLKISNPTSIVTSNTILNQKCLKAESSLNENILEQKNSFGTSKPFKPHFHESCSVLNKKSDLNVRMKERKNLSAKMALEIEKSSEELGNNSKIVYADLDSRLQNLLNKSDNNYFQFNDAIISKLSSNQPESSKKATSKLMIINSPSNLETKNKSEEISVKRKRPSSPVSSLITNQRGSDLIKIPEIRIKSAFQKEEPPPKNCDFICDLIKEPLTDEDIFKTVRAKIKKKGKITSKDGLWKLDGLIFDCTAELPIEFSSEFMESILGFTTRDFSMMKKRARTDPDLEEQIRRSLRDGQHKLEQTDWLMQLKLTKNKIPLVVKASELTQEQKEMFEKSLQLLK